MINCYKCIYRRPLPGDAHSKCVHPSISPMTEDPLLEILGTIFTSHKLVLPEPDETKPMNVKINEVGKHHGWCNFPWNYDPIWIDSCDGYTESNPDPKPKGEVGC